jgi:hypothetical protein
MLRQRNSERYNVIESLEVVMYSKLGMPDFTNEFEISYDGICFNPGIDYKYGELVVIRLFMEGKAVLDLYGVYLKNEDNETSVIKFEPLRDKQRQILSRILEQATAS